MRGNMKQTIGAPKSTGGIEMSEQTIEKTTFTLSHCPAIDEGKYSLSLTLENAHAALSTHEYSPHAGNNINVGFYSLTADQIHQLATLLMDKAWELKLQERHNKASCGATTEGAKCSK